MLFLYLLVYPESVQCVTNVQGEPKINLTYLFVIVISQVGTKFVKTCLQLR